ncbi:hypothetical protein [Hymenobacter weizhouensis]|uniref:hypothetical protein n=1 Tax=Hymenobacter sp. YIM 151500-1 TaxID=2987689 RepID=UPI002227EAA9|nr:hypothetical protein [Hymenobacter sp. YIM 151500-1]UYZ64687.1 hypothetical protein OIS53_07515 [Hymenobacter sp. YIM 151500-1]
MKTTHFRNTLLATVAATSLWSCQQQDLPAEPKAVTQAAAQEGAYRLTSYKLEEGIGTDYPITYTTAFTYRPDGKLASTDGSRFYVAKGSTYHQHIDYDYSQPGQVVARNPAFTNGVGAEVKYVLGTGASSQRASQIIDVKGIGVKTYTYNAAGQITREQIDDFSTRISVFSYDAAGNRVLTPNFYNSRISATYDLTKLNRRPVPDVLNLFVDKGTESRNLLSKTVEETDPAKDRTNRYQTNKTYTYELNSAGYVTKKTEDIVFLDKGVVASTKKNVYTYTYEAL